MGNIIHQDGYDAERIVAQAIADDLLEADGITPSRAYFTYHDVARAAFRAALTGIQVASGEDYAGSYDLSAAEEEAFDEFLDISYEERQERAAAKQAANGGHTE